MASQPEPKRYIGRFAPSPSGPLHMGSLVCALASFLHARQHNGLWLVRIEDIDPPREVAGAADAILMTLRAHGLHWDGDVLYQSTRTEGYLQALRKLRSAGKVYRCNCNRKRLLSLNGVYDGHCLRHPPPSAAVCAWRFDTRNAESHIEFDDGFQGRQTTAVREEGDFIVHRKDGLFAYQLAVVVDDIAQQITHVVRGMDLLECTARQTVLFDALGHHAPRYAHIPLLVDDSGQKLSKQNHAPAIDNSQAAGNLRSAIKHLGMHPPAQYRDLASLLSYAVSAFAGQRLKL